MRLDVYVYPDPTTPDSDSTRSGSTTLLQARKGKILTRDFHGALQRALLRSSRIEL